MLPTDIQLFGDVQREYGRGSNPREAFKNLCQKYDFEIPLDDLIDLWMKNMGDDKKLNANLELPVNKNYLQMLQNIHKQYSRLSKAVYLWTFDNTCSFFPTNPRYTIKGMCRFEVVIKFEILDYYHGQTKELPLVDGPFKMTESLCFPKLHAINSEYVVIFDTTMAFVLYLFKIDLNAFSTKFLDQNEVNFMDTEIVFDEQDSTRFLIIGNYQEGDNDEMNTIAIGRIKNDKIQMHHKFAKISLNIFCFKLVQNKLCGLKKMYDNENKFIGFGYWEMDLNNPRSGGEVKFQFKFECDFDIKNFYYYTYTWSKTSCYVYSEMHRNRFEMFNVYAFDLVSGKCTCLLENFEKIRNICIDENDVLNVQAWNAMYRFPLSQPEKLQNIAWFNMRRLSNFSDNEFYEKAVSKLPLNSELRPFYFKF